MSYLTHHTSACINNNPMISLQCTATGLMPPQCMNLPSGKLSLTILTMGDELTW